MTIREKILAQAFEIRKEKWGGTTHLSEIIEQHNSKKLTKHITMCGYFFSFHIED